GLRAVKAAGGLVLAQDEASSVVFGMPGQAAKSGMVDAVLSVDEIGARLMQLTTETGESDGRAHPRR
ncbi:MAG TPA: chemotaxis protein CheB, partial [Gemmatimonadaceae bacterium]|nr:chemotaxis protein CheB [Gemmatimonadaceae bacterium]